jgi:cobalt-zinc-cadmium efflux system membrane fusion protein
MKNSIKLGIIVLMLAACNSKPTEETTKKPPVNTVEHIVLNAKQVGTGGIVIETPKFENVGATIRVNGKVEVPPQNKTAITFAFGGFVKSIKVLDGMPVKKGQVLLTLQDPEIIQLQQDFLESTSQLEYLKADYDRQRQLNDQQANSQKTLQLAKSAYLSMLAKTKGLRAKLEMAGLNSSFVEQGNIQREVSIRAPFNGVVTKMHAEVGTYAQAQDVLMELIDLKHNHIEAFVFEKDVAKIKIGQLVHVKASTKAESFNAKVFLIGKEIGSDKTVKVHLHLEKEDQELIPGTYVQAFIDLTAVKSLVVPTDGLVQFQGKDVVFEQISSDAKQSVFRMIEVERIGEENNKIAIRCKTETTPKNLVVSGAYSILSAFLIQEQGEE